VAYHDKILKRIKAGEIPRAVTYELLTEITSFSELSLVEKQVYDLTLMLSAIKHNDIKPFYCIVESDRGDIVHAILYTDLHPSRFIRFFKMIDDEHMPGGTERYVNECYDAFMRLHEKVNLHPFIFDLLFAARTEEVHISLVVLILGLEYLVTYFGRMVLGWEQDDAQTLIGKLKRLNTSTKCIPALYLNNELTHRIRNPLIHTGTIVNMSRQALETALLDLHRLTALVFLRLVGYTGVYLNYTSSPEFNRWLEGRKGDGEWEAETNCNPDETRAESERQGGTT